MRCCDWLTWRRDRIPIADMGRVGIHRADHSAPGRATASTPPGRASCQGPKLPGASGRPISTAAAKTTIQDQRLRTPCGRSRGSGKTVRVCARLDDAYQAVQELVAHWGVLPTRTGTCFGCSIFTALTMTSASGVVVAWSDAGCISQNCASYTAFCGPRIAIDHVSAGIFRGRALTTAQLRCRFQAQ